MPVLPARAKAKVLGGDPRKGQVEGVAYRRGDEDDQQHPREDRRDPEEDAIFAPPASESARHPGILHQRAGRRYANKLLAGRDSAAFRWRYLPSRIGNSRHQLLELLKLFFAWEGWFRNDQGVCPIAGIFGGVRVWNNLQDPASRYALHPCHGERHDQIRVPLFRLRWIVFV